MSGIDWSKAPEGFPLWLEGTNADHQKHSGWYRKAGEVYQSPDGGQWRSSREGQLFTVHCKPDQAQWNGEGLPPVGTELEAGFACEEFENWHKGICVASGEDPEGRQEFCVVQFGNKLAMYTTESGRMRPIRTAEQIAADERLHEIRNALTTINSKVLFPNDLVRGNILAAAVEAMIDAGYRKVTP